MSARRNGITVSVAIVILMIITAMANKTPIIYSNLAHAHVSYDQFKLIYHADISLPFGMSHQIEALMDKAEGACLEIGDALCEAELRELRSIMKDMQHGLEKINAFDNSKSAKRSWCDTCGWAMKKM